MNSYQFHVTFRYICAPCMHALQQFNLRKEKLWLTPDRAIFWENEKALIVSDLHFGKTGHFRKFGIPVPQSVYREDLQRLITQIQYFTPSQVIVVGDLFHSKANKELDFFKKWRNDFGYLQVHLVRGNHDILNDDWYRKSNIVVNKKSLKIREFCFQHDMNDCESKNENVNFYVFSGHIHPGITINGIGKQSLRFPCFYFTRSYCILPAFSRFTGAVSIEPKEEEVVFAIVNNSVIRI